MAYDGGYRIELETLANQAGMSFTPIGETDEEAEIKILQGGLEVMKRPLGPIRKAWEDRWKPCFE